MGQLAPSTCTFTFAPWLRPLGSQRGEGWWGFHGFPRRTVWTDWLQRGRGNAVIRFAKCLVRWIAVWSASALAASLVCRKGVLEQLELFQGLEWCRDSGKGKRCCCTQRRGSHGPTSLQAVSGCHSCRRPSTVKAAARTPLQPSGLRSG